MKPEIDDADRLVLYRLLKYLDPTQNDRRVWTYEHACIEMRETWNRCGVPADTHSWSVLITHPDIAWTVRLRMARRDGDLLRPLATHVAIENFFDDEDRHGGPAGVAPLVGEWLRSLPL